MLLLFLGVNKQLDLQTLLTLAGRRIAISQGWYDKRKSLQVMFIGGLAVSAVAGFALVWRLVRPYMRELAVSLFGFVLLLAFILARAASFHHVDKLINLRPAGIRMNWVFELGGIALIAIGPSLQRFLAAP